mmetsp:Transcript_78251/g.181552  ORF Transcript_78251/g.181552 Transcript_78251/m.181552 type:complete len:291 (-) Transcript_78251:161-1033(-)
MCTSCEQISEGSSCTSTHSTTHKLRNVVTKVLQPLQGPSPRLAKCNAATACAAMALLRQASTSSTLRGKPSSRKTFSLTPYFAKAASMSCTATLLGTGSSDCAAEGRNSSRDKDVHPCCLTPFRTTAAGQEAPQRKTTDLEKNETAACSTHSMLAEASRKRACPAILMLAMTSSVSSWYRINLSSKRTSPSSGRSPDLHLAAARARRMSSGASNTRARAIRPQGQRLAHDCKPSIPRGNPFTRRVCAAGCRTASSAAVLMATPTAVRAAASTSLGVGALATSRIRAPTST